MHASPLPSPMVRTIVGGVAADLATVIAAADDQIESEIG
jgi:hypothetical protein